MQNDFVLLQNAEIHLKNAIFFLSFGEGKSEPGLGQKRERARLEAKKVFGTFATNLARRKACVG